MEPEWTVIEKKTRKPKSDAPLQTKPVFIPRHNTGVYTPPFRNFSRGGGYTHYSQNSRKKPDIQVAFISLAEEEKFTKLQLEIPHLMMPCHIRKIEKKINIDELADRLLSDEWVEYQREGWVYEKVIKPDETGSLPDGDDYDIRPLGNKWGDVVLFKKV